MCVFGIMSDFHKAEQSKPSMGCVINIWLNELEGR